jgi:hypothetical protein
MQWQTTSRLNYLLGVPVVVLTTFVGTSVFATLQEDVNTSLRILVGAVSVFAAVLASLQTFLRYPERAEKHRIAGKIGLRSAGRSPRCWRFIRRI